MSEVLEIPRHDYEHLPALDKLIAEAAVKLGKARIVEVGGSQDGIDAH
jgi:hypothetical protein